MTRLYLILTTILIIAGCKEDRFQKTKSALEFKLISGDDSHRIKYGNTIKFSAEGYYRDSLLETPYDPRIRHPWRAFTFYLPL